MALTKTAKRRIRDNRAIKWHSRRRLALFDQLVDFTIITLDGHARQDEIVDEGLEVARFITQRNTRYEAALERVGAFLEKHWVCAQH